MSDSRSAQNDVRAEACPACKAAAGQPCRTVINGVDMGWDHDARILAPIIRDLRTPPGSADA